MKIKFTDIHLSERETELSQEELAEIFEALKYQFLTHIEYTSSFERNSSYETPENLLFVSCAKITELMLLIHLTD